MNSVKNLRIIGKYNNQDYLLFFLRLYYNNKRKCPEIEFGTPEVNYTKHGETGIQHIKYDGECKDIYDWAEQKGYNCERKPLIDFKDVDYLGNACIYQKDNLTDLAFAKIKPNNYQYYFLDLKKVKCTINAIVVILNKELNYKKYITIDRPNCDNLLFIELNTDYNFSIFIHILDCYVPTDKK